MTKRSWLDPHSFRCVVAIGAVAVLLPAAARLNAQPADAAPSASTSETQPTEVGVRFTPRMSQAISRKIVQHMKDRYNLDETQSGQIEQVLNTKMLGFAQKNAQTGRDLFEMMMETMLENDGRFPKDSAIQFANMIQPMLPAVRDFLTESAGQIGQVMSVKQRLKLTGDMAAATAGFAIFENRMKRWQEGQVSENANPFFDRGEAEPTSKETEPKNPKENPEHRRAKQNVERWVAGQIDLDKQWNNYVDRAIEFYSLDETQQTSARAILDDSLKRAAQIKTPEWREKLMNNRIARQLSWGLGNEISQGPFMYKLEADFEKLRKPLMDLEMEFKRRIDSLPNSEQRATAREQVRKALQKKGVTAPPL